MKSGALVAGAFETFSENAPLYLPLLLPVSDLPEWVCLREHGCWKNACKISGTENGCMILGGNVNSMITTDYVT